MQVKVVKRKEFNKLDKDFLSRSRNFLQKVNVEKETKARVAGARKRKDEGATGTRATREGSVSRTPDSPSSFPFLTPSTQRVRKHLQSSKSVYMPLQC